MPGRSSAPDRDLTPTQAVLGRRALVPRRRAWRNKVGNGTGQALLLPGLRVRCRRRRATLLRATLLVCVRGMARDSGTELQRDEGVHCAPRGGLLCQPRPLRNGTMARRREEVRPAAICVRMPVRRYVYHDDLWPSGDGSLFHPQPRCTPRRQCRRMARGVGPPLTGRLDARGKITYFVYDTAGRYSHRHRRQ
jgi:hypothetical protein